MSDTKSEFEKAGEEERQSLAAEFVDFLKHNKLWWMTPIILVLLLLAGLLTVLGTGSAAAPFIYALF